MNSRGRRWFEALTGAAPAAGPIASLLVGNATLLRNERVRYLAIVPDPHNRFPRARNGQVGLEEGWNLAKTIRETIAADREGDRRAIVAIVDVPGQAYGRREELLGLFLACAAATDAYASARTAGHPVITLVVGRAISGGFLAHGAQANRIVALDDAGVTIHAMAKKSAARVTRRSIEELDRLAEKITPMAYDIRSYARLGMLHRLIEGVNADAPDAAGIRRVQDALCTAIGDARAGPRDLACRLRSEGARRARGATLEVVRRLTEHWNESPE